VQENARDPDGHENARDVAKSAMLAALHDAARAGDAAAVDACLDDTVSASAVRDLLGAHDHNGQTAADAAMRAGHLDIASGLMAAERCAADEMQVRLERLEAEAIGNSREASRLTSLLEQAGVGSPPSQPSPPPPPPPPSAPSSEDPRIISDASPTCSWESIAAYAGDQATEAAAGRGPRRADVIAECYRRYSRWCEERGHTGVDLILSTSVWREVGPNLSAALEPNIVPYHLDPGIEHWVLWYHPDTLPGRTDLDASLFAAHLRLFLPTLREEDELLAFQNLLQFRSVPQMAHAHVFLRPLTDGTAAAVRKLRAERRMRSPWAEAERLGGRGSEVGWGEDIGHGQSTESRRS
jgi:hypothetical protein